MKFSFYAVQVLSIFILLLLIIDETGYLEFSFFGYTKLSDLVVSIFLIGGCFFIAFINVLVDIIHGRIYLNDVFLLIIKLFGYAGFTAIDIFSSLIKTPFTVISNVIPENNRIISWTIADCLSIKLNLTTMSVVSKFYWVLNDFKGDTIAYIRIDFCWTTFGDIGRALLGDLLNLFSFQARAEVKISGFELPPQKFTFDVIGYVLSFFNNVSSVGGSWEEILERLFKRNF
ncbi:MAG: hypothetical protein AB1782_16645 [Cyanobacteriota bacterium]